MKTSFFCGVRWPAIAWAAGLIAMGWLGVSRLDAATICYVSPAGDDANDGLTWPTAKLTVQAGLSAAASGDQVWVAAGTYVENITLKSGVALYGGFAGDEDPATFDVADRDLQAHPTILDGNQSGSVVTARRQVGSTSRIDGFTITNGKAYSGGGVHLFLASPTVANNRIVGNSVNGSGGGLMLNQSFSTITNNSITGNTAAAGGGLHLDDSWATITYNTISGNSATGNAYGDGGGGLCLVRASPGITGNTITGNTTTANGGGLSLWFSNATVSRNTIARNRANLYGGGLDVIQSSATIISNAITDNTGSLVGGGLYLGSSGAMVANNLIAGNSSEDGAGLGTYTDLAFSYASPTIASNTIAGNRASWYGGGLYIEGSSPVITNTIIALNSSGIYAAGRGESPVFYYNCIYGNASYNISGLPGPIGTNGNIGVNPRFVSAGPGTDGRWGSADLRLLPGSPCIDAGGNSDVPSDWTDIDGDYNTSEPLPLDLAGKVRFAEDPATPDTGSGTPPIVDIGAYEFVRPGDVNGDGHVDVSDLLSLVNSWAKSAGQPGFDPRCDFDADARVSILDLLVLVNHWGM